METIGLYDYNGYLWRLSVPADNACFTVEKIANSEDADMPYSKVRVWQKKLITEGNSSIYGQEEAAWFGANTPCILDVWELILEIVSKGRKIN